jgi:hypothetical protein
MPRKLSTPFSHTTASSTQKNKGKHSHQDTFVDETKAEATALANLASDKHVHRMAELDIKKQQMALDAQGKQLEAEECLVAARHQHEREKEQHDMEMLCLRLQLQGGGSGSTGVTGQAATAPQFGAEVFPNTTAFGNLGMGLNSNYHM